jgi:hypothetical protein
MNPASKLLPVCALGALALACSLNPQPLPPDTTGNDAGHFGATGGAADAGARGGDGATVIGTGGGTGKGDASTTVPNNGKDGGAPDDAVGDASADARGDIDGSRDGAAVDGGEADAAGWYDGAPPADR